MWKSRLVSCYVKSMGLNLYIKAQKSSSYWWCHLHVSRYCWMRSTILSCPRILGAKRCMLCFLLMFGGLKCENHVRRFASNVRFVNMQRTAHWYPQVCWNHYPLLIRGLEHSLWTLSLGYLYVQMVATLFSPVSIV